MKLIIIRRYKIDFGCHIPRQFEKALSQSFRQSLTIGRTEENCRQQVGCLHNYIVAFIRKINYWGNFFVYVSILLRIHFLASGLIQISESR